MDYINRNSNKFSNVSLIYSTPAEYVNAINYQGEHYPRKYDDFFPYRDAPDAFWTGYFTSRVSMKAMVKENGRFL